jgi:hypothetical protein
VSNGGEPGALISRGLWGGGVPGIMKVIYVILTTVGWLWLVIVMVYLWIRLRREARARPGEFELVASNAEAKADRPDAVPGPRE